MRTPLLFRLVEHLEPVPAALAVIDPVVDWFRDPEGRLHLAVTRPSCRRRWRALGDRVAAPLSRPVLERTACPVCAASAVEQFHEAARTESTTAPAWAALTRVASALTMARVLFEGLDLIPAAHDDPEALTRLAYIAAVLDRAEPVHGWPGTVRLSNGLDTAAAAIRARTAPVVDGTAIAFDGVDPVDLGTRGLVGVARLCRYGCGSVLARRQIVVVPRREVLVTLSWLPRARATVLELDEPAPVGALALAVALWNEHTVGPLSDPREAVRAALALTA